MCSWMMKMLKVSYKSLAPTKNKAWGHVQLNDEMWKVSYKSLAPTKNKAWITDWSVLVTDTSKQISLSSLNLQKYEKLIATSITIYIYLKMECILHKSCGECETTLLPDYGRFEYFTTVSFFLNFWRLDALIYCCKEKTKSQKAQEYYLKYFTKWGCSCMHKT